ncbi:hypothetical protein DFH94DRAFT_691985 [Russula ochroleuca]|uniref:Uncharacterized protein n=1 Tax=Russula ochroleuca TaxID=152965 RepID=A0A9P5T9H5_9AGAM|nr:hypothetical protein DFH94DRAFT_691985 [Russula ochroleuca]
MGGQQQAQHYPFMLSICNLWWSNLEPSPPSPDVVPPRSPRIAKAKERYGFDIAIDIYERNDYIGGRKLLIVIQGSTSAPPSRKQHNANKSLLRAANEF